MEAALIPIWIKIVYTLFVAILIPIYAHHYRVANFLWFSDIALIATVAALWLENSLIASMMTVGILIPETVWNLSYFGQLLSGRRMTVLTAYMFDAEKPRYLRALSLFHVFLPPLLIYMIAKLGYDESAWKWQTMLGLIVLPLTYWVTSPDKNINWVHMPANSKRLKLPPKLYLALEMIAFPILLYLPAHFILMWLFG